MTHRQRSTQLTACETSLRVGRQPYPLQLPPQQDTPLESSRHVAPRLTGTDLSPSAAKAGCRTDTTACSSCPVLGSRSLRTERSARMERSSAGYRSTLELPYVQQSLAGWPSFPKKLLTTWHCSSS